MDSEEKLGVIFGIFSWTDDATGWQRNFHVTEEWNEFLFLKKNIYSFCLKICPWMMNVIHGYAV